MCAGAQAAIIVADLTDLRSFVDIGRWVQHFTAASPSSALPFPVLLLANKSDSPDRVLSDTSVAEWADRHRLTHSHVVSAKTGSGVEEAFRGLVSRIGQFVPVAGGVAGSGGGLDATQRLLSLLHSPGLAKGSPSHSPSASKRPSASITPTSRTRASMSLSVQSLLSTLPPSAAPRMLQPSASPRVAVNGVGRSPAHSYSALTVQRLTAGSSHLRQPGASVSLLGRQEAMERDNSRSGSFVEEKEWMQPAGRKQLHMAGGMVTPTPFQKHSLTALNVTATAGGRPSPYSPSAKEVDLRF